MDEQFLKETLRLAKKGMGWTNPNPMVGAVIVRDGQIIVKGYHKKAGLPHAEIEAIKHAKESLQGAILYVNLEPCIHFGKTPPCVNEIIKSRIKRVVCSTLDPNPKVSGKGLRNLERAGIATEVGLLKDEARALNEPFFVFHEKKRPFIALKFAASLDGKIATQSGDSKWITNQKARHYARNLRSKYQAILVGINTVLRDNPNLGDTLRIILDSTLKIPLNCKVLRDTNVLIATTIRADMKKTQLFKRMGIPVITFDGDKIPLNTLLKELTKREIISILVEGGGKTLGSFMKEKLVDKVYAFQSPILIGEGVSVTTGWGVQKLEDAIRLQNVTFKRFDDNRLTIGYI